jgi:hypothetical protein
MWRSSAVLIVAGLLWPAVGLTFLIALVAAYTPILGHAVWLAFGARAFGMFLTGVPALVNFCKNRPRHMLYMACFEIFLAVGQTLWFAAILLATSCIPSFR